jgi:hypothetical protein
MRIDVELQLPVKLFCLCHNHTSGTDGVQSQTADLSIEKSKSRYSYVTEQSSIARREIGVLKKGDCHEERVSCLAWRHPEPDDNASCHGFSQRIYPERSTPVWLSSEFPDAACLNAKQLVGKARR